ncbi:MAG: hypothetical protein AAGE01_07730 [Pseudomonadota bacterium]
MIRALRISGFLLMGVGVLVVLSWAIAPLRQLWPVLLALPFPVKIGLAIAVVGFCILMGSLIAERMEESRSEGDLLDDELDH